MNRLIFLVIGIFSLILIFQPTFADHPELEGWLWQKGVTTFAKDGDSATTMTLTLPSGQINSQSVLLNYLEIFTDQYDPQKTRKGDGYIQVGVVYPNFQQTGLSYDDMTFFYYVGHGAVSVEHPYNVGAKYTFQIFYEDGWWIYVTDDVSDKRTFIKSDLTSGKLTRVSIVLENIGVYTPYQLDSKPNTLTQTKDVGTLSNIVDQQFYVGNRAGVKLPSNVITGWDNEYQRINVDTHTLVQHIAPPQFALFENNNGVYEVGFESVSNSEPIVEPELFSNPESESKLPEWVRNIFIWYASGEIGEDDLINALQFLIKEGIIKT